METLGEEPYFTLQHVLRDSTIVANLAEGEAVPQDLDLEAIVLPREVVDIFRVSHKTVNRWALEGRLPHFRTPGGHLRFRYGVILELFNDTDRHYPNT